MVMVGVDGGDRGTVVMVVMMVMVVMWLRAHSLPITCTPRLGSTTTYGSRSITLVAVRIPSSLSVAEPNEGGLG